MTKSAETWIEIPQTLTMEEMSTGAMPGIMDVQSSSEEVSTEGTKYNTW
jgi:general secretion pathway protein G